MQTRANERVCREDLWIVLRSLILASWSPERSGLDSVLLNGEEREGKESSFLRYERNSIPRVTVREGGDEVREKERVKKQVKRAFALKGV